MYKKTHRKELPHKEHMKNKRESNKQNQRKREVINNANSNKFCVYFFVKKEIVYDNDGYSYESDIGNATVLDIRYYDSSLEYMMIANGIHRVAGSGMTVDQVLNHYFPNDELLYHFDAIAEEFCGTVHDIVGIVLCPKKVLVDKDKKLSDIGIIDYPVKRGINICGCYACSSGNKEPEPVRKSYLNERKKAFNAYFNKK